MPSKADVKAWKAQLVAQAEQQILKLTDSDQFKKYLNTLAKFHRYSARNIDLIYAQNPQALIDESRDADACYHPVFINGSHH